MADTVTTKTLISGDNILVQHYTNVSDGTGETNVVKVDRSTLSGPEGKAPKRVRVDWIQYSVQGFEGVKISWDDTLSGPADENVSVISGEGFQTFMDSGGSVPTLAASDLTSAVGDILFSTVGTAAANDTYSITIRYRLK